MPTQRLNLFYGGQPGAASGFDTLSTNARGILDAANDKARFLANEEDVQYRRDIAEQERARRNAMEDAALARHNAMEDEDRLGLPILEASKHADVDPATAPARFRPAIQANTVARRAKGWDDLSLQGERFLSQPAGGLDLPGGGELTEGLTGKGGLSLGGERGKVAETRNRGYDLLRQHVLQLRATRAKDGATAQLNEELARSEKELADMEAAKPVPAPAAQAAQRPERTYHEGQRAQARMLVSRIKDMPQAEREARGWSESRIWELYKIGWPQDATPAEPIATPPQAPAAPAPAAPAGIRPPLVKAPVEERGLLDLAPLDAAPAPLAWKQPEGRAWGRAPLNTPNVQPQAAKIENLDPELPSNGAMNMTGKFVSDVRAQAQSIAQALASQQLDEVTASKAEGFVQVIDHMSKQAADAIGRNDREGYLLAQRDLAEALGRLRTLYQSRQPAAAGSLALP